MLDMMMEEDDPVAKPFDGIRFVLIGFDYQAHNEVRLKLVGGGGEYIEISYIPNCTHVIVDKCVYDDSTCVNARRDGKIVVSALWVHHSYDIGMPADHANVIYRPLKDLNGIPGAKKLVMCLTGYQGQDRDDIMTMVALMGAEFSKPLVASRITHLICYKFEGEKYEVAKKLPRIKLVNHKWLEDCLSFWELLPEEHYAKCGYEMEAEVKDSEEENAEGSITEQFNGRNNNVSVGTQVENREVPAFSPSHSNSKVSLIQAATIGTGSAEQSKLVTKENEGKITSAKYDNNSDLVIDARGSVNVVKQNDQSPEPGVVKKSLEAARSDIVENPDYQALSPSNEKKRASSYPSGSVGSAKKSPDSFLDSSITLPAKKTSQILSLRNDRLNEQLSEVQPADALTNASKIEPKSSTCNKETSKAFLNPRNVTTANISPSKRKKDDTCYKVTEPKSSHVSTTPGMCTDNFEVKIPEQLPVSDGDNPDALNLVHSSETITAQKHIHGIVTLSSGLMPTKSKGPQNARLSTGGRHITTLKSMKNSELGKNSGSKSNVEAGSSCSVVMMAEENQTNLKFMSSVNQNMKSKPGKRKGPTKNITVTNMSPEAPSHDAGFGKPKELAKYVEEKDTPIGKPLKKKKINDSVSVGTRVKSVANAISNKCSLEVTKALSTESLNGEKNENRTDTFTNLSNTYAVSSADDSLELGRIGSFGFIKDFEGACRLTCDETEDPWKAVGLEPDITRAVTRDRETESDQLLGDNNSQQKTDQTRYFTGDVDSKIFSLENELVGGAMNINAKRGKTHCRAKVNGKSRKKAKKTAGIKKIGHDCSDRVTAVIRDQPEHGTMDNMIPQKPNSSSEKLIVDANRLVNVLESEKENRPLLDNADGVNINERISSPPNFNTLKDAVDANKLRNVQDSDNENSQLPDSAKGSSFFKEHPLNAISRSEISSISGIRKVNETTSSYSTNNVEVPKLSKNELKFFVLSGHRSQKNELKKIVQHLKGRLCRDSHQWSYQATHFVVPEPMRTEKFFAAAASGRWILKPDYLTESLKAGKFLDEEPYEWHSNSPCQAGKVDLIAPRKWRILRDRTGHGAFHGMRIIVYGDFFNPPLDTLKRVVKAGDGIILATAPPYTRFLSSEVDFAIISQGMPKEDPWVQEFLKYEIPCVAIDYLVEFVCKPGSPLQKHVLFETDSLAEKSYMKLVRGSDVNIKDLMVTEEEDLKCNVCGSGDREEQMLICGDEKGSAGCGIGTHVDCCDPPLKDIPEDDWFCSKCSANHNTCFKKLSSVKSKKKTSSVKTQKHMR